MFHAPSLCAFVLLALTACANRTTVYLGSSASLEAPLQAIMDDQAAAWNAGDLESFVERGYLNNETLGFYGGPEPSLGYDGVLDRYRASYAAPGAEMGHLTFSHLNFQVLGPEYRLGTGRWQLDFSDNSQRWGWFTLVFVYTNNGWRIMHDHSNEVVAKL